MMRSTITLFRKVLAVAFLTAGISTSVNAQCTAPASVSGTAIRCDSAAISWPAATGVNGYIYAVNQTATYTGAGISTTATTARQGGLYPNTTYYVHVRSNCGTGVSGWTRSSFTTPACGAGVCLAPNTTTVGTITNNAISYSWNAFPGAQGYEYVVDQISGDPAGNGTFTTSTSATATGLSSGNLYFFHVRTQCGPNSFSPWRNATPDRTTGTDPNCATPGPIVSSFIRCDSMSLSWPVAAAHTSYLYSFAPASSVPPLISNGSTNTINRRNLNPSTLYYVQVLANCGMGRSATRIDSFLTPACNGNTPCQAPASAGPTNTTPNSISFAWTSVSIATGYEILLNRSATTPTGSGNAMTGTSATASNLTPNTTYYFHIRTKCGPTTFSPWKAPVMVTTAAPTAVSNSVDLSEQPIAVYPNPASGQINIDLQTQPSQEAQLEILSMDGKLLKTAPANIHTVISIADLQSGIYLIRFTDKDKKEVTRFTKN